MTPSCCGQIYRHFREPGVLHPQGEVTRSVDIYSSKPRGGGGGSLSLIGGNVANKKGDRNLYLSLGPTFYFAFSLAKNGIEARYKPPEDL